MFVPYIDASLTLSGVNTVMSLHRCLFVVLSCFILILSGQNAFAFRCDGGLVNEGDNKLSVLSKCGKPNWVDRWTDEIVNFPNTDLEHRFTRINERWIYNFGPNEFIRIVTFSGSTVSGIETGSHGFTVVPDMQRCDLDSFALGVTSGEVAARCGEPDLRAQRYELVTHPIPGGRRQISVTVDEWTFDLGPTSFMRLLIFRNGNLVEIRTGEKGVR